MPRRFFSVFAVVAVATFGCGTDEAAPADDVGTTDATADADVPPDAAPSPTCGGQRSVATQGGSRSLPLPLPAGWRRKHVVVSLWLPPPAAFGGHLPTSGEGLRAPRLRWNSRPPHVGDSGA